MPASATTCFYCLLFGICKRCYGCQTVWFYIGRYYCKILIQQFNAMESNLCAICFVDDDLHLVKVGEKSLGTLLQYSKLLCDDRLEKVL